MCLLRRRWRRILLVLVANYVQKARRGGVFFEIFSQLGRCQWSFQILPASCASQLAKYSSCNKYCFVAGNSIVPSNDTVSHYTQFLSWKSQLWSFCHLRKVQPPLAARALQDRVCSLNSAVKENFQPSCMKQNMVSFLLVLHAWRRVMFPLLGVEVVEVLYHQ